ncbi:hypothetical protein DRN77_03705 [Methanosarcinales archaeon]|nr:MAG: hypothetical protein DRN77_03705 [Methanosarcinales archaeon]
MNTVQRIARNMAALFTAHFIVVILSLILSIFIARKLGDVAFGKYSFVLAFTAVFAVFSDLGYNTLLIREVARDESQADKYLNNILSMRLLLSLIIFVLITIIINVMDYPADVKNITYLFAIYILILSFSDAFKVTFRAFEKMKYESGITVLSNAVRVSLGLLVLLLGYGLLELALVFLVSGIFDFLISFLICEKKFVKSQIELDLNFWKSTIRIALPLGLLSIFGLIYVRIDTLMLSMMKGDAVVGWYNAAYKLVLGFKPIPQLFMNAIFPLMARYYVSSNESLRRGYEKSFTYLLILGLPLATGITLLADKIILLLYGEQFVHSVIALQILAWDTLLIFICMPIDFMLVSMNKQNQMAAIVGGCALLNIILNLILIPSLSYIGAGIATIITEIVLFMLYFYFVSKYLYRLSLHKIIARPLIACSAMVMFIHFCGEIGLAVLIISAAVLYAVVLCLIGGFDEEDRKLIDDLISKEGR